MLFNSRPKSTRCLEQTSVLKIYNGRISTHNIGIQMKQKELTKTFVRFQNEKPFCLHVFYKNISAF